MFVLVGEEVVQRDEQEGAELASFTGEPGKVVPFQQPGEEALGQVLCRVRVMPSPADVGIEREPIGTAKLLQRLISAR